MEKKQLLEILIKHQETMHYAGSCGELGDSTQAIDADCFEGLIEEILQDFEPKKCMPDNVNSKEEHEQYLKDIGYEKHVKKLQHYYDATIDQYAIDFDPKELVKRFVDSQSDACSLLVEDVEQLIKDWGDWIDNKNIGKSPFDKLK